MATDGSPLRLDTAPNAPSPPPIAAAFLVNFDHRKGYVLGWQRSIDGVQVEGAVELKSLPSGLHNVEEDLIYFVHHDYVGVSAYINKPDAQAARNANMLAVGVLVPVHHGRMGKSWLHAEGLKTIADKIITNPSDTASLEKYWEDHRIESTEPVQAPDESTDDLLISKRGQQTNGYHKFRSMSTGSGVPSGSGHILPAHHPAATLIEFLDVFGPLIFPLYRVTLLRKRILIVAEAPVEFACNIVYNLSILSSLPKSLSSLLPSATNPYLRPRPLFTVGISDIPLLSTTTQQGWIACTTDDVLATKPECFDVLVFLPSADAPRARVKTYPRIVLSEPDLARWFPRQSVKASQRDAQRYAILRDGLRGFPAREVRHPVEEAAEPFGQVGTAVEDDDQALDDHASTLSTTSTVQEKNNIVELPSWSQVAYTSLLWWASAGDRRAGLTEAEEAERETDLALLDRIDDGDDDDSGRTKEIVVVSFFRRLTCVMFEGAAEVVVGVAVAASSDNHEGGQDHEDHDGDGDMDVSASEETAVDDSGDQDYHDDDDDDEQQRLLPHHQQDESEEVIPFTSEDMSSMALDMWSASDRKFVEDFVRTWWGSKVRVTGRGIECCGVKIL